MIGKKSQEKPATTDGVNAYVGRNTTFEGKIRFEGIFRIDGTYDGEVLSGDSLVVGETAEVNAQINVNTLTVHGHVNGNITAKNRILIHSPGKVLGDIQTPVLVISEGAIFQGNCQMGKREDKRDEKVSHLKKKENSQGEIGAK
jgi:cytoskeletal protein CcmA (bactofilin family)